MEKLYTCTIFFVINNFLSLQVFDLLLGSAGFAEKVQANTDRFRSQMTEAGFTIAGDNHPICPVMLGDARLASQFADAMLGKL